LSPVNVYITLKHDILGPHVTEGESTYRQRRLNYCIALVFPVVSLAVVAVVVLPQSPLVVVLAGGPLTPL
jgi:hypothetical protein